MKLPLTWYELYYCKPNGVSDRHIEMAERSWMAFEETASDAFVPPTRENPNDASSNEVFSIVHARKFSVLWRSVRIPHRFRQHSMPGHTLVQVQWQWP